MRIERIRTFIWGVDVLVILAVAGCIWLFFVSSGSVLSYDQPGTWKNRHANRGKIELPQTEAWSNYGRLLTFPKDGLRPPPPVVEDDDEGPEESKDAVNRLATLIGYRRFTIGLDGRNARLTDGVQRALGRQPRDLSEYARKAAATGAWNAPERGVA